MYKVDTEKNRLHFKICIVDQYLYNTINIKEELLEHRKGMIQK